MRNRRTSVIPLDVAAKVQFLSDRTCCVCRKPGKPVQIHHIDSDPTNNDITNLAVLCLDCHMQTLVSGGFYRKLDAKQVRLYRDNWLNIVERQRARKKPVRFALVEAPKQLPAYRYERPKATNHLVREKPIKLTLAEPLEIASVNIIDNPDAILRFRREWLPEGEGPPRKRGTFPILEVKLKNNSQETVFLRRLEIDVLNARITYDPATYHALPVSWEYNVLLNPHERGSKKSVSLSQAIEAGKVGRFIIIIGQQSGYGELKYADYELRLWLFCNKGQGLDLGIHRLRAHSPLFFAPGKAGAIRQLPA